MKSWEIAGQEKFENLLKKFENHPLTQTIRQDEAAKEMTKRQQAAWQIEILKSQQRETVKHLQAVAAEKEAVYLKAKTAMEAAGAAFNQARGAFMA